MKRKIILAALLFCCAAAFASPAFGVPSRDILIRNIILLAFAGVLLTLFFISGLRSSITRFAFYTFCGFGAFASFATALLFALRL
jgi:hypothetical protein